MSSRRKKWLIASAIVLTVAAGVFVVGTLIIARRVEPYIREQTVKYLRERFDSEVELARLDVQVPTISPLRMLFSGGRGTVARVEGAGLSLRHRGRRDVPPMLGLKHFSFEVDLGALLDTPKTVNRVTLDGLDIHVPPKGERPSIGSPEKEAAEANDASARILIEHVLVRNGHLTILPKDKAKFPLKFTIYEVRLESAGKDVAMRYTAHLTNPKPPGDIRSTGIFGPWAAEEPSDTPLKGEYQFRNADLSVFAQIAGTLQSTGKFEGTLSSIKAKGEATVPDFRLTRSGNPVPLSTTFEVLVDGTNGNTELKPVVAKLGSTNFTTTGFVVKHDRDTRKTILLRASMPAGNMRDLLTLAMRGSPMMSGTIRLDTIVGIPPLEQLVKEKLMLDGTFEVTNGKFLQPEIRAKIDELSRRGQGKNKNDEIGRVVHRMSGTFKMANETLEFHTLAFSIPGADINIGGKFDMDADQLDFHGAMMLDAKLSQTQSGWKRWVLKAADPFFAKRGAGTFLHIKVVGSSKNPQFGLDPGGTSPIEEAEKAAAKKKAP